MRIPRLFGTAIFLAAWLLPWRPAFCVRSSTQLKFFVHRRDFAGRHIAKYGIYEPQITEWIRGYLAKSPAGIVIDVGANIGWYVVHAAQFPTVTKIIAFEPDAFNAWLLDRNLGVNRIENAIVHQCAVGEKPGFVPLHRYKNSNNCRHSVLADYGFGSRLVPLIDLDTALAQTGIGEDRVLVMKIDVEGYEPQVIAGARRTLGRTNVVITEFSPHLTSHTLLAEMGRTLRGAGFSAHLFGAEGDLVALTPDQFESTTVQCDIVWLRQ